MSTLKEVREQYQEPRYKKIKKMSGFSKYFYTKMATPIIKMLLPTKVTANQVTVFWVILGMVSCVLLALGNYWVNITAVLLLQLHIILDYVDGPIARARNQTSLKGVYIERVGHDVIFTIFFFCIAVGSLKEGFEPTIVLMAGFCSAWGYFFYKYTRRAMIYCSLVYRDRSKDTFKTDFSPITDGAREKPKVGLLREIYRKTQSVWDPPFFITLSLPLALCDLLYVIPLFYGLTYPFHFFLSYIHQAKIMDSWVDEWVKITRS